MIRHPALSTLLLAVSLVAPGFLPAQLPTEISGVRFNSGQDIVPYFEGWIRNRDGTFDLVFGYFNRNWQEELVIPTGSDNAIEPGGPAAGQPTYFLPRRQRWVFRLRVPADFGKKEVSWTITTHGRTEKAYGTLLPAEEINERVIQSNGNLDPGEGDPNAPPSIETAASLTAQVGSPITLTTFVRDDGLPQPRPVQAPRPSSAGGFGGQVDRPAASGPTGLTVKWFQYGGPARVSFEKTGPIPVADGKAATTATFPVPGTYRVRATANDGALSTSTDIVITVR